jgi:hypothetical protein
VQETSTTLGVLTAVVMYGGWYLLWELARRYPANPSASLRSAGRGMQYAAGGTTAAMILALIRTHRDSCGKTSGWEATAALWLFVATVVFFMLGVVLATASTEWVAIAAVTVVDLSFVVLFSGQDTSYRPGLIVLFGVHGICTAVTAVWSRRVRGGTQAVRAKGGEAGRILASGWIAIALLAVASAGHPVSTMLPDSTFAGLFIVTSIGVVMGTGYTKYAEAKQSLLERDEPHPDLINALGAWHHRYSKWF